MSLEMCYYKLENTFQFCYFIILILHFIDYCFHIKAGYMKYKSVNAQV
jgi:hypothetical protein